MSANSASSNEPPAGSAAAPRLVPLLDLVNHDADRAPFTSYDASAANVAERLEAGGRATRADTERSRRVADGEDWCLWSYDTGHARPRGLAAGDEVLADYAVEDYDPSEWFANLGFVPP